MENNRNIIIETVVIGNSVKVTAIDPVTGEEGTIVGSPKVSKKELANLAIRKLDYVKSKNSS